MRKRFARLLAEKFPSAFLGKIKFSALLLLFGARRPRHRKRGDKKSHLNFRYLSDFFFYGIMEEKKGLMVINCNLCAFEHVGNILNG